MCSSSNASYITIDVLDLSRRAYNCLRRAGICTVDQLAGLSDRQLLALPGLGSTVLAEIREKQGKFLVSPLPGRSENGLASQAGVQRKSQELASDDTPLYVLGLAVATEDLLAQAGITTIGQLSGMPLALYLSLGPLRRKARKELEGKLKTYLGKYPLAPPEPPPPLVDTALLDRVAAAPLDQISLRRLALPDRVARQLHSQGIETIGGLFLQPVDTLGQRHAIKQNVERYLSWLAEQDEATWAAEIAQEGISPLYRLALSETTLETLVCQWLSCLKDRHRQVIHWRYGLDGRRLTLEEVGQELGFSRERARQIQATALDKLGEPNNRERIAPFKSLMAHLLTKANGVMGIEPLTAGLQQHVMVGDVDPGAAVRLLAKVDEDLQWFRKADACGLTCYPLPAVDDIHKRFVRLLTRHPAPPSVQTMLNEFKGTKTYMKLSDDLDDAFLLACLQALPGIEVRDGRLQSDS